MCASLMEMVRLSWRLVKTENSSCCLTLTPGSDPTAFGNCRSQRKADSPMVMGVSVGGIREEMVGERGRSVVCLSSPLIRQDILSYSHWVLSLVLNNQRNSECLRFSRSTLLWGDLFLKSQISGVNWYKGQEKQIVLTLSFLILMATLLLLTRERCVE